MVRVVVRDGTLVPLDPLPAEWADGRPLRLGPDAAAESPPAEGEPWWRGMKVVDPDEPFDLDVDEWLRRWHETPGLSDEDMERVQRSLDEQREKGKAEMRRLLGMGD